ncbi:MAG: pseudouridine synthase [Planctomycetota bacterium]
MDRLQKVLARAGVASRRKCEEYISAGRVAVDGEVVRQLGTKVDPAIQVITCDGERVRPESLIHLLLHKPAGVVCSSEPDGGHTPITELVRGIEQRLFTVGRLDADSEGLVLLTNDGELANRLTHPRYQVPKTYEVELDGRLSPRQIARLKEGVRLPDGVAQFDEIRVQKSREGRLRAHIVLHQGLNREIRRAFGAVGRGVIRLRRVAIGRLTAPDLRPGAHRKLTRQELATVREDAGLRG